MTVSVGSADASEIESMAKGDAVQMHEVIVAGGGPAGCHAALELADRGHRVLLLEKCRFPRWKPCAGGISAKTHPYVPRELTGCIERVVTGAYLTLDGAGGTHVAAASPVGWTVHRESFDEAHLALARAHRNVEVVEGSPILGVEEKADHAVVSTRGGELRARVVVGADGANSVVSRAVPGHASRPMGVGFEGEAKFGVAVLDRDVLFDFRGVRPGYGWIFPKKNHYSVGVYVYRRRVAGLKRTYDEFAGSSRWLEGCRTYRSKGYRIPLGGGLRKLNTGRILLVGDAGDLVDPFTGEGIYYAFRSAHLAAEAISACLSRGDSLDAYGRRIRSEIQSELRYARMLAGLVFRFPETAFRLMVRSSTACRWLVGILTGEQTYRGLVLALLRRGWKVPLKLAAAPKRHVLVE